MPSLKYDSAWWSITVPDGWTASREETCSTFIPDSFSAAIQISTAAKDDGPVTDDDLKEFAEEKLRNGAQRVGIGSLNGFSIESLREERYWKEWWLRSGRLMVYATFICEEAERHHVVSAESFLATFVPKNSR